MVYAHFIICLFDKILRCINFTYDSTFNRVFLLRFRELFRYVIAKVDYKALSTCFSKAKQLYTILLREKETVIHVEDLMFELHAAEMNQKILKYILQNQDKTKIDFLDYITYFPLFIHTHDVIVQNPI